ncbi:MAG: 4Fe-4S binding protein [Oscillospiraceae bacterium]|nr:4Fe-4S binding protein [Oscillospiraceae bacterium]
MAKIKFNQSLCTACGACSLACMDEKDTDVSVTKPYRTVSETETVTPDGVKFTFNSKSCLHCEKPVCLRVCPRGCFYKDKNLGLVLYDNSLCIGCRDCYYACPVGVPSFNGSGRVEKCDGCADRQRAGLTPACVRVCPTGALHM